MTTIKLRRGEAALWVQRNPVLAEGEPGMETDTGLMKIGDGQRNWIQLSYNAVGDPVASTRTLAAGTATIVELDDLNHWTVPSPTQLVLPAAVPGTQVGVHVVSGWGNLTWPAGTVLYGESGASEVWVTLVREAEHWTVLVPGQGHGLEDSGRRILVNAVSSGGQLNYSQGSPAFWASTGWGGTTETLGATNVSVRRLGRQVSLTLTGVEAKANEPTGSVFVLPNGFRPTERLRFAVPTIGGSGFAQLFLDGAQVKCTTGISTGTRLGGVREGAVYVTYETNDPFPGDS